MIVKAKVSYWNEFAEQMENDVYVVAGKSLTDIVGKMDVYFGADMDEFSIQFLETGDEDVVALSELK